MFNHDLDPESDSDSINTNTTDENYDENQEWAVEKILAERTDDQNGRTIYLIKWEGWPLGAATWQTSDSLNGETLLRDWEAEKRDLVTRGEELFDVDIWMRAFEALQRAKAERRIRREMKRRRRKGLRTGGAETSSAAASCSPIAVAPETAGSRHPSSSPHPTAAATLVASSSEILGSVVRVPKKAASVKRKRAAHKVPIPKKQPKSIVLDDEDEDCSSGSSEDALFVSKRKSSLLVRKSSRTKRMPSTSSESKDCMSNRASSKNTVNYESRIYRCANGLSSKQ